MADWSGTGDAYARSFAQLTTGSVDALLDAVADVAPPPATLLDVGTGSGNVLVAAVERGWSVRGADADVSMADAARRRAPGLRVDVTALPELAYPDHAFDAVTANFVVNHVADPRRAAAELARVAREVVVLTIWASSPLRPLWDEVLDGAGIPHPPEKTLDPALDFERTEVGLAGVLDAAGLQDVVVSTVTWDLDVHSDDLWLGVEGGIATVGGVYRDADVAGRERMAEAYRVGVARRVDARGHLVVPLAALLASGRPPAAGS